MYSYRRKFIFKTNNFASSIKLKLNKKDRKEGKKIKKRKTRDNKLKKKENLKKKRNNFFSYLKRPVFKYKKIKYNNIKILKKKIILKDKVI